MWNRGCWSRSRGGQCRRRSSSGDWSGTRRRRHRTAGQISGRSRGLELWLTLSARYHWRQGWTSLNVRFVFVSVFRLLFLATVVQRRAVLIRTRRRPCDLDTVVCLGHVYSVQRQRRERCRSRLRRSPRRQFDSRRFEQRGFAFHFSSRLLAGGLSSAVAPCSNLQRQKKKKKRKESVSGSVRRWN